MANNRKPKLAPGSRLVGDKIVDSTGATVWCEEPQGTQYGSILHVVQDSEPDMWAVDALAAIRAAKLDPVFDPAAALAAARKAMT